MKDDQKKKTPPPLADDDDNVVIIDPVGAVLGGGIRGEVAGCPTGCSIPARRPKSDKEDEPADKSKKEPGKE